MKQTLKKLTLTSLPLLLGMAASAINHLVDSMFLGHYSETSLAACLPGNMLGTFFTGFLICTIGYTSTFVAQFHGAGKYANAWSAFLQGIYLSLLSIPVFLLMIPVGDVLVGLTGHESVLQEQERIAFHYAVLGGIVTLLTTVLSGFFTGQGKTRLVGLATVAGCVVNMALDPLLIFGLDRGIAGAGLSSVIGCAVSCLVITFALTRDRFFRMQAQSHNLIFRPALALRILRFGTPFGLSALVGSGSFTVFVMALGHLSTSALALGNACFAINNVFYTLLCAIESALVILVGRAFGKKDIPTTRRTVAAGHILVFSALLACYIPILIAPKPALRLFSGNAPTADDNFSTFGFAFLFILLLREIFEGVQHILTGALRGVGDTRTIFRAHFAASVLIQIPLVVLATSMAHSPILLWATLPFTFAIHALLLFIRWQNGKWQSTVL